MFAVPVRIVQVHIYPFNETGLPVAVIKRVNSNEKYSVLRSWHFVMYWRDMKDDYVFVDEKGVDITTEGETAPDKVFVRLAA
jgi:hypothetical protein